MIVPQVDSPVTGFRPFFNPATGEWITFTATSADSGGQLVRFSWRSVPGGVITEHVHPLQEERFIILAGEAHFTLNGAELVAKAGETVVVPAGVPHSEGNPGPAEIEGVVELRTSCSRRWALARAFGVHPYYDRWDSRVGGRRRLAATRPDLRPGADRAVRPQRQDQRDAAPPAARGHGPAMGGHLLEVLPAQAVRPAASRFRRIPRPGRGEPSPAGTRQGVLGHHSPADWIGHALHGQVVMVPEAGHYPQSQRPDITTAAVVRFLESVQGRT